MTKNINKLSLSLMVALSLVTSLAFASPITWVELKQGKSK